MASHAARASDDFPSSCAGRGAFPAVPETQCSDRGVQQAEVGSGLHSRQHAIPPAAAYAHPSDSIDLASTAGGGNAGAAGESRNTLALFVRRAPEEYSVAKGVESTLTARLRQQASREKEHRSGISSLDLSRNSGGTGDLAGGMRVIQVRVHLPPYEGEASVAVMSVPSTMRVADLRTEVIRQNRDKLGSLAAWDLRFYDEDEDEPDCDCPLFDDSIQVGCLGVSDIALCRAVLPVNTSPSPPLSSPIEDVGETLPDVTPQAKGGMLLQKVSFDCPRDTCIRSPTRQCSSRDDQHEAGFLRESATMGSSSVSPGVEPSTAARTAHDANAVVGSTAAHQSTSSCGECLPRKSSTEHATADPLTSKRTLWRCRSMPQVTSVVVGGFEQLCFEQLDLPSRAVDMGDSTDVCATFTRLLKIILPDGPSCPVAQPAAGIDAIDTAVSAQTAFPPLALAMDARESVTSQPVSGVGDKGEDGFGGKAVVLEIRRDATLFEVMQRLSRDHGRAYDPVNFAFERVDDGIRQRVDPDAQVSHLHPQSSVLAIVRKDGGGRSEHAVPTASTRSLHTGLPRPQFDLALRRPPPSAFFFNEYTASMTKEYFVTVAVGRGPGASRSVQCTLVVDRERLYHNPLRVSAATGALGTSMPQEGPIQKKASFMPPLLKKFTKHLQLAESSRAESSIFAERRVCDIKSIACEVAVQRGFSIIYLGAGGGSSEGGTSELVYQAQTPTECAEIVARIEFLRSLAPR